MVRDLKVYSQAINASVAHYRDNDGLECDAIIHKTNGDWGALEIKLGGKELIDKACSKLLMLKNKIDYTRFKKPFFSSYYNYWFCYDNKRWHSHYTNHNVKGLKMNFSIY